MIRPHRSSLSRKPFVSPPAPRLYRGRPIRQSAEINWIRAIHGPLPPRPGGLARGRRHPAPPGLCRSAAKAVAFLLGREDYFGIREPAQLAFVRRWRTRSGTHIRFQQVFHGIPVIGALLDVHLDRSSEVCMVRGAFHRHLRLLRPLEGARMTKKQAVSLARDDLGRGCMLRAEVKTDRLIHPERKGHRLVYKVVIPASRPLGNWVYLIDPSSGAILYCYNTMRFARARGRVYLSNPREDPRLSEVSLLRLESPVALRGGNVVVSNEDFPEASSPGGSFVYEPDDTHFDEVMVYYHVDRVSEFYRRLDPSIDTIMGAARPARALVHVGEAMDNAYYDPSTGGLYFGDGGGESRLNDLAKEAAVIYHEFTHAVLDHINRHMKGNEADALHEGYADYCGCTLTGDAQIGEWAVAPRGEPYMRDLTNRKRYPRDMAGEAHADGEIWSGACWDLRQALGRGKADSLVYESMHFLPEFARFSDAASGIIQADATVFSGRHASIIRKIMSARGLSREEKERT